MKNENDQMFWGALVVICLLVVWVFALSGNKNELQEQVYQLESQVEDYQSSIEQANKEIDAQNEYLDGFDDWFDTGMEFRYYAEDTPRLEEISL